MKKFYVLDTSSLLHDWRTLTKFDAPFNEIHIPIVVISELNSKKRDQDNNGFNARQVSRILMTYKNQGSLKDGVKLPNGGTLKVSYNGESWDSLPAGLPKTNDNRILLVAKKIQNILKKRSDRRSKIIVITEDSNLAITASACDIHSESCSDTLSDSSASELYSGYTSLSFDEHSLLGKINTEKMISAELFPSAEIEKLYPNQCCKLYWEGNEQKYALAIFKKSSNIFRLVPKPSSLDVPKDFYPENIRPKNDEQAFAYALLNDPDIWLVTMLGKAGTGKTLMALAAAYRQLEVSHNRIVVYRPVVGVGEGLGHLKGGLEEKLQPWCRPIYDNMELILGNGDFQDQSGMEEVYAGKRKKKKVRSKNAQAKQYRLTNPVDDLVYAGLLEMSAVFHTRGRTLLDSFVVVDEGQNTKPLTAKTLITRAGKGTKMVICGDADQIDAPYLNELTNGLTYVIMGFLGQEMFGHITMHKSERSDLAQLGADLLK